jgi:uncharacterized protein
VVAAWPTLKDRWLESAAVGAASKDPATFLEAVFRAPDPAFLAGYVPHVAKLAAEKADATVAVRVLKLLASQPASVNALKSAALEAFVANLSASVKPALNSEITTALKTLLSSEATAGAALPLVARWDTAGALADDIKPSVGKAMSQLNDAQLPDDVRARVAANLVGVRLLDSSIIPSLSGLLAGDASSGLKGKIIEALGTVPEGGKAIAAAFPKLGADLIEPAFSQILKRSDSARAFLEELANKSVPVRLLGPARIHRLRTYGDADVAKRANEVIDSLAGPEQKEKDALIAKLTPDVVKPGDAENGHKLFLANCAGCHIFKKEGRDLAPNLTGMGAHGPADLLVHIVDPNRLVEPNFISVAIEKKDGTSYEGIIARENASEVVLRDAATNHTIRVADIQTRSSTGRSLMPEGFEALGGDGLRDVLAYICADENRFRILDLSGAFTANTAHGMYMATENDFETVTFKRFGLQRVEDVPFDVISPEKLVANAIVLKGGSGYAKTLPQKVEVKVGVAARRLHFLGGVAGWGWPYGGDNLKEKPAAKITLQFADGATELIDLKNGVELADYVGDIDVPGSKGLPGWVKRGQVRWISKPVHRPGVIQKLVIESYDNEFAPTFFAITAEVGAATSASSGRTLIQIVGGGSSHDFGKWWGQADTTFLNSLTGFSASYTENPDDLQDVFKTASVLYLSHNKPTSTPAVRKGIFDHVKAGKGLVIVHAANWLNWADWPEYNRDLVSGVTRGHDSYGEFEVVLEDVNSPILNGVPKSFKIKDELYHFEPDANGPARTVLATAKSPKDGKVFPIVWVTQTPEGRVVCITLGHDGAAHNSQPYQTLLKNAVTWAAGLPVSN